MKRACARMCTMTGALLLSGGLVLAQGYAPGVNPSNPQDLTNRGNPQSLTVPGGSNPQDLVRSPALPSAISPAPRTNLGQAPPVSLSVGHTHIDQPVDKPVKKRPRHKPRVSGLQDR
ncbi:MAG TPA: hypothetical protein VGL31_05295 [Xanthobacteraceae bacterium]